MGLAIAGAGTMFRLRLSCVFVTLIGGIAAFTVASGYCLPTAMAKGSHGGHSHAKHRGAHHTAHHASRGAKGHHHARASARHHALARRHGANRSAYARRHGRGWSHYAAYRHPHRYYNHRYAGWSRWNGYYNGTTYVGGGTTVVGGPTVVRRPGLVVGTGIPRGYYSVLGTISAVNGNAVTITRGTGAAVTVNLAPGMPVTLNSGSATAADLLPADRAKVRYDSAGNVVSLVALRN
jgi:hypothetical protein